MAGSVSVVIVNYNAGQILRQSLKAVLASTVPVHLLLVDNASTDGSLDGLDDLLKPPHLIIRNDRNLGFARACNQGLNLATGDYLLLLNPDCLVQPDTLQRVVDALKAFPEAGMAGCRILNPDGTEQRGCRRNLPELGNGIAKAFAAKSRSGIDLNLRELPDMPVTVPAISGAFMMVRRAAWQQVGGLDEDYFLHCEDLDWCKKFSDAGWNILFVPEVEVTHHQGACSEASPISVLWHKHKGMLIYFDKHLANQHGLLMGWIVKLGVWFRFILHVGGSWLRGVGHRG